MSKRMSKLLGKIVAGVARLNSSPFKPTLFVATFGVVCLDATLTTRNPMGD